MSLASPARRHRILRIAAYAAMVFATAAGFELVRRLGGGLVAPPPDAGAPRPGSAHAMAGHAPVDTLLHVLLALAVVITAARAMGALFRRLQQPPVIGEVLVGILLGPSLFGRVAPAAHAYLMPAAVAPYLGVLAQVGVIFYMFLVGLELDPALWRQRGAVAVAISHGGILAPFLLGSALALLLYPLYSTSAVPFTVFALFIGASLSVTAFPVLARILADRGIQRSRLGLLAVTSAAAADATAWCLLAVVASIAGAHGSGLGTVGLTVLYVALMWFVARPFAQWILRRRAGHGIGQGTVAFVFVALLLSSLATEYIGIHALFGAFLLGAILPHDGALAHGLRERLEDVVAVLLLPAFFAFVGMRTQIGLVDGAAQWALCGLIIAVASVGKGGGTAVAARLAGLPWRESISLGVLMNTRGLMELVVLNLGLDLGILSPTIFAMMVVMALATTMATPPLLSLLTARHAELVSPAEPASR